MTNLYHYIVVFSFFLLQVWSKCPDQWIQSSVDTTKCYLVVTNATEWFLAEHYCYTTNKSDLVSITTAFEVANINKILAAQADVAPDDLIWIGLNDMDDPFNGKFRWTDGKPFNYTNWDNGQPNLDYECAASVAGSGKWRSTYCRSHAKFICEKYLK